MIEKDRSKRYWRVSKQHDEFAIVEADNFTVSERGDLLFHTDKSAMWQPIHTINKHYWRAITECDKEGNPLWSRDISENALGINVEADISSADIEALTSYIESTTERAIRKAMED